MNETNDIIIFKVALVHLCKNYEVSRQLRWMIDLILTGVKQNKECSQELIMSNAIDLIILNKDNCFDISDSLRLSNTFE